eukprot:TRINITY_DN9000_c2_g1_i1.p2 TRINITY_DN9000_c2_g1~~TRINITY_DN9000_c2_g1_i1.p2  ORF type:complete len:215 (+),score=-12.29 TRINITY_DN9000_c2_g1_i1:1465-2109(+)
MSTCFQSQLYCDFLQLFLLLLPNSFCQINNLFARSYARFLPFYAILNNIIKTIRLQKIKKIPYKLYDQQNELLKQSMILALENRNTTFPLQSSQIQGKNRKFFGYIEIQGQQICGWVSNKHNTTQSSQTGIEIDSAYTHNCEFNKTKKFKNLRNIQIPYKYLSNFKPYIQQFFCFLVGLRSVSTLCEKIQIVFTPMQYYQHRSKQLFKLHSNAP